MRAGRAAGAFLAFALAAACAASPEPGAVVQPADPVGDLIAELPEPAPEPSTGRELTNPIFGDRGRGYLEAPAASEAVRAEPAGTFGAYLSGLRDASCPQGVRRTLPEAIELNVRPVSLQGFNPGRRRVGELTYAGGFHLTSPDERFGGLSGLALLDDGSLLAVSDQGDFVWIELGADGVTPSAARMAPLRDVRGTSLSGNKIQGDAEGLAVNEGLALVSFEREHRILAYDIEGCGASARGAPIVTGNFGRPLPEAFRAAGISVGENSGAEPLAVTPDWYVFTGLETSAQNAGPLSARPIEAAPDFALRVGAGAPAFVGIDVLPHGTDGKDVRAFSLHRAYNPLSGNAITILETILARVPDQSASVAGTDSEVETRSLYRFETRESRRLAELNMLFTIDNFEGLAAQRMPDGGVRLYIVSDDNFAARQRTLLFVFDLPG